jgi:hypothetical protein
MMVDVTYQMLLSTLQTAGILVGIFYYITTLRNQNKARKTQLYMQIATRFGQTQMVEARNKYSMFDWKSPTDLVNDFSSYEGRMIIGTLASYYEGLGILVKEGLLDIRIIALFMTGTFREFWGKLMPVISEFRTLTEWPRAFIETEYLYQELTKYLKEHPELEPNP